MIQDKINEYRLIKNKAEDKQVYVKDKGEHIWQYLDDVEISYNGEYITIKELINQIEIFKEKMENKIKSHKCETTYIIGDIHKELKETREELKESRLEYSKLREEYEKLIENGIKEYIELILAGGIM